MIVVRNIFRLKFGAAKEATDLWKQILAINARLGYGRGVRLLTDLVGLPYYSLILEATFDSLAQFEQASEAVRKDAEWRKVYEKVIPLTEDGRREILTVLA